jgi:hypothetical protein
MTEFIIVDTPQVLSPQSFRGLSCSVCSLIDIAMDEPNPSELKEIENML